MKKVLVSAVVLSAIIFLFSCTSNKKSVKILEFQTEPVDEIVQQEDVLQEAAQQEVASEEPEVPENWEFHGPEININKTDYDFVYKIKNTTSYPVVVKGYIRDDGYTAATKTFVLQEDQSYEFKFKLDDIVSFANKPSEEIVYLEYKFYISETSWNCFWKWELDYPVLKNMLEYYKNQIYSVAVVFDELKCLSIQENIDDYDYYEYDEIIPGDGKSPVKLQLRNRKEYIEADWSYCRLYKKVPNGYGSTSMRSADWHRCSTGKEESILLNYNPNNGYYGIDGKYPKVLIRPYTVEELNILIGVKPATQEELDTFFPEPK